ncbi:caspase domain-containing protein [Mycena sp. CBHHK59/15]|nr:caspase domain-containing protein [Mycena sp. CBHHK59/15]
MSTKLATDKEEECRVFALIIGIDQYSSEELPNLRGCVNDATSFKDFLTEVFRVPESHIEFMTDEVATREAILSKFRTHLIENPAISDYNPSTHESGGDTLIFFYAGHGSRAAAPNNVFSPTASWKQSVPMMKERQTLMASKGNNVTAIFDSCNSGGMGRGNETPRYVGTHVPIPKDLDADLMGNREARPVKPKGFRFPFMESHILLAACRQDQIAFETSVKDVPRGRFTESLVRTLRGISLETSTYVQLIDLVGTWVDQNPQLEGKHTKRLLFNGIYPPISKMALPVKATDTPGSFEIQMGSIDGVVRGTEFTLNDANNKTLGFLVALSVELDRSILVAKDTQQALMELPDGSKATVLDWKNPKMTMMISLSPDMDSTVTSALFPERDLATSKLRTLPRPRKFVLVDSQETTVIALKNPEEGKFVIERLTGIIKDHAYAEAEFNLEPTRYHRLPKIMDGIAHFNYFLDKHHGSDPLPTVTLEMHVLTGVYPNRGIGPDIFRDKVAEFKASEKAKYGFTLCNRSQHDLFAYLFYFDPAEYVIDVWYCPLGWAKMSPPLAASADGIVATRLPIGYGTGGYAFEFFLPEGKSMDTGFLKVFVSTEYLDMEWITQKSPFSPDYEPHGRLGGGRETVEKGQVWDAFHSVVTMTK